MCASRLVIPAGKKFGLLTVIRDGPDITRSGLPRRTMICSCKCGTAETQVRVDTLTRGKTKSCGCLRREAGRRAAAAAIDHGVRNHSLYPVWQGLRRKIRDPRSVDYQAGVCEEWLHRPVVFIAEVEAEIGPRPDDTMFARIDEEKDFMPGNIRWATLVENWRRRRLVARQADKLGELERANRQLERLVETLKGEIEMYKLYGRPSD
jgi:hypothetical protein